MLLRILNRIIKRKRMLRKTKNVLGVMIRSIPRTSVPGTGVDNGIINSAIGVTEQDTRKTHAQILRRKIKTLQRNKYRSAPRQIGIYLCATDVSIFGQVMNSYQLKIPLTDYTVIYSLIYKPLFYSLIYKLLIHSFVYKSMICKSMIYI